MSFIRVFTSKGNWSEPIVGLDKVWLMKSAIQNEYTKSEYWRERCSNKDYPCCVLKDLEIDSKKVTTSFMDEYPVIENNLVKWDFFKTFSDVDIKKATTLKMRLSTFREIADGLRHLSDTLDELITRADIPTSAPEDHCLMFKFEDEI